jgi:hypothetical protein
MTKNFSMASTGAIMAVMAKAENAFAMLIAKPKNAFAKLKTKEFLEGRTGDVFGVA